MIKRTHTLITECIRGCFRSPKLNPNRQIDLPDDRIQRASENLKKRMNRSNTLYVYGRNRERRICMARVCNPYYNFVRERQSTWTWTPLSIMASSKVLSTPDLLISIANSISSDADLSALSRCNRTTREYTLHHLYRDLEITYNNVSSLAAITAGRGFLFKRGIAIYM